MPIKLTIRDHNRDIAGLKYIYPVMSRRAGGLSIGINFNPNNACNWRCIYCQVPDLQRGVAPAMDFPLLESELRGFLDDVQQGRFFDRFDIAEEQRVIKDIAISGNGEPSSLENFAQAIQLIGTIAQQTGVFPDARFVLISNGSLINQSAVQDGLRELAKYQGELWFKLDSATPEGRQLINNARQSQDRLIRHLKIASNLCSTKLQTCLLRYQQAWSDTEKIAYLTLLKTLKTEKVIIGQIMLYSTARESFQPEAAELIRVNRDEMEDFAADIKAIGYDVSVSG